MICVNARFLTQSLSGVQRFAVELSLRIKRYYGDDIVFLCPKNIVLHKYAEQLDAKQIGKYTGYLWEQVELPLYLRQKGGPLLINLCNMAPLFYENNLYTLHDAAFKAYAKAYSYKYRLVYGFMVPILLQRCKHVITVSNFSKKEIHKLYGTDIKKIVVVYNAIASQFFPIVDDKLKNTPYLFTITSTGDNKNFNMVLDVFLDAAKYIPGLKLYAAGKTLKEAKYTKYKKYADNPNIIFLGYISDDELIRYYSNALAFMFPSIYEGFGIPPLEAQMCKCPVVASTSGPLPEVLGSSALCADPFNKMALAKHVVTHPEIADEYRKKGIENVKRFSFENSAKRLIEIINKYKV